MENMKNVRTIEINGVKFDVDMTNAKRIDEFRVGDNIKVLRKGYGSGYNVLAGVIVEFVNFKELPTIVIAVFETDYSGSKLNFFNYNAETKDIEITKCSDHELRLEKNKVIDLMNNEIEKYRKQAEDVQAKKDWFLKYFNKYFINEGADND